MKIKYEATNPKAIWECDITEDQAKNFIAELIYTKLFEPVNPYIRNIVIQFVCDIIDTYDLLHNEQFMEYFKLDLIIKFDPKD